MFQRTSLNLQKSKASSLSSLQKEDGGIKELLFGSTGQEIIRNAKVAPLVTRVRKKLKNVFFII